MQICYKVSCRETFLRDAVVRTTIPQQLCDSMIYNVV